MQIKELSQQTNLSAKTTRYYEEIGLLPPPRRLPNGYRDYEETAVSRVKFVVGARTLGLSLDDISELRSRSARREAPCRVLLQMLDEKATEIRQRIADLQRLEVELRDLHALGLTFPTDDVDGKHCVCHLVSERAES